MAGLEAAQIDHLKDEFPTPIPPPNLDLTFTSGDPSNPWTLAVACAEGAIADALQVYIYAAGRFMSADEASKIYASGGLEGLAGVIQAYETPDRLQWVVHEVIDQKIQASFANVFERMLSHYLRDYWPTGAVFRVRVGR